MVWAIKTATEAAWKSLCDQVQKDPWGLPYKLVMCKLAKQPPIPEINTPGRLLHIIGGLFPQHPTRNDDVYPEVMYTEEEISAIDIPELWKAARSLKPNTAQGPDGISNEIIKIILTQHPDLLINTST